MRTIDDLSTQELVEYLMVEGRIRETLPDGEMRKGLIKACREDFDLDPIKIIPISEIFTTLAKRIYRLEEKGQGRE